ncbi:MAG: hypothetical protein WC774_03635 [Candidatus Gracilibacteria bacterium]|jgi:hypothetical protein
MIGGTVVSREEENTTEAMKSVGIDTIILESVRVPVLVSTGGTITPLSVVVVPKSVVMIPELVSIQVPMRLQESVVIPELVSK